MMGYLKDILVTFNRLETQYEKKEFLLFQIRGTLEKAREACESFLQAPPESIGKRKAIFETVKEFEYAALYLRLVLNDKAVSNPDGLRALNAKDQEKLDQIERNESPALKMLFETFSDENRMKRPDLPEGNLAVVEIEIGSDKVVRTRYPGRDNH